MVIVVLNYVRVCGEKGLRVAIERAASVKSN